MARDGLFFQTTGRLNARHAPAVALVIQGVWASILVLPRTVLRNPDGTAIVDPATGMQMYGNLYSSLLEYVIFAALIFYVLTTVGIFVLRRKRPDAERPYRAIGYPILPILYIVGSSVILAVLLLYKTQTTWPGLLIVLTGVPVYAVWRLVGRGRSPDAS
jgi:APA family basic amino acid/polyamine antiporter